MENFNWVREFNKLLETLNDKDSYFSGGKFISIVREFDPYFPDYNQFIEHRRQKDLSTSRKNYFYDILMSFKEDMRKPMIDRLYEVAKKMKAEASKKERGIDEFTWDNWTNSNKEDDKSVKLSIWDSGGKGGNSKDKSDASDSNSWTENIKDERIVEEDVNATTETIENPIVFISYSWDNEDHKSWILNLAKRLFDNGVQVILDRYELKPGANLIHFMESSVPKADKVLIIFTPNYKLKAEKRQGGVGFEYSILNAELYQQITTNQKFIPIIKLGEFQESIPSFMQQFIAVDMRDSTTFEDRLNELLLAIYDKPQLDKPLLGKSPFNRTTHERSKTTDDKDINIEALKEIKSKTKFLWKGFSELDNFQNSVTEEIKEKTLKSITKSIDNLQMNGLLSYSTVFTYEMIATKEKVYSIKVNNIATQLKNLVKLINEDKL